MINWLSKKETEEPTVTLVPLAMIIPNLEGVYNLSRFRKTKTIPKSEWYTYTLTEIKVGTPDNWHWVTAYSKGLSCYYIAV